MRTETIYKLLLIGNILICGTLIYLMTVLPDKIKKSINEPYTSSSKDTTVVVKSSTLTSKSNFVYFCGNMVDKPILFKDNYPYRSNIPDEIYDGCLTLVESEEGGKYYIWSKNLLVKSELEISGWFIVGDIGTFGLTGNKEYVQILFPIVNKN